MESRTTRIWTLAWKRPDGLMNATWPFTRLPSGTMVLPFATTSWMTSPRKVSPGLLVFEVNVVPSRTRRLVPGGIFGATSSAERAHAIKTTVASVARSRFMGCPFPSTSPPYSYQHGSSSAPLVNHRFAWNDVSRLIRRPYRRCLLDDRG